MHKILRLKNGTELNPIVTASTGNHGLGVARALQITGLAGTIYVPSNASPSKIAALRRYPVELSEHGRDSLDTELFAKAIAHEQDAAWISPYNDPDIIAGQGTVGLEITRQLDTIDAVYATVGGGGLISGIASWFAERSSETVVIGCLPENSPEMKLSMDSGQIVHLNNPKPTLSDGSAGGLEDGSITFPICQRLVGQYVLVSEDEIADAIARTYEFHRERIEGSAGVAVAAMLKDPTGHKGKNIVVVICGGNIDDALFNRIVE
jgi:threonine dehydratase